jgi:hypothetical protein
MWYKRPRLQHGGRQCRVYLAQYFFGEQEVENDGKWPNNTNSFNDGFGMGVLTITCKGVTGV